jgi:Na+/proline symporter
MLLEYATLAVYLGVLLALGAYFTRFNKNISDFVRGGGQGSWWLIGTSILMSAISAFTFTGNASAAFEGGPSLLVIYAANCAGFACGGLFVGRWLRQTRAYTTADVVRMRYGVPVEQFGAVFGVLIGPITAAIQLYALALFASTVLSLPLIPILVVVGVIVTLYSTTGGKWAVMATDFVQAMVMLSITALVFFLSMRAVGGVSGFFGYIGDPRFEQDFRLIKEAGAFPGDRYTLKWAIIVFFMQINAQISLGAAGRYISARDGREASRSAWLGFVLMAIGSLVWFIPPMVARFLYGEDILASGVDKPADSAYAFIAMKLLPNGLLGMLIAAMFAATMSSMDTGLNGQVGVVVNNIIPRIRGALGRTAPLGAKLEMRICHVATVCLGSLIIFYALLFATRDKLVLFDVSLTVASVIGVPMAFPMFVGLWLRKLPKWSYFPIFGACLAPSIWSLLDEKLNGTAWTLQDRAMWIMIAGVAATLVCMLFANRTGAKEQADVKSFFKTMDTPINYDTEIGAAEVDYEQYFVLSKAVLVVGILVLLVLFVPNDLFGRLCILAISAFILSISALLWWGGHRVKTKTSIASGDAPAS